MGSCRKHGNEDIIIESLANINILQGRNVLGLGGASEDKKTGARGNAQLRVMKLLISLHLFNVLS
jgi:hypothetical protein